MGLSSRRPLSANAWRPYRRTYPIFDTALVSILRKLAGRPISVCGRNHSSHRLASLGLDQRRVAWLLWLLTAAGSILGLMIRWIPGAWLAAVALLTGLLGMFGVFLATVPGYPLPGWVRRVSDNKKKMAERLIMTRLLRGRAPISTI